MGLSYFPIIAGRWVVDCSPSGLVDGSGSVNPLANGPAVIVAKPSSAPFVGPGTSVLTSTGLNAVLAQIEGYLTAAKLAAISAVLPFDGLVVNVTTTSIAYSVALADIVTQANAIAAILETAADAT